MTTTNGVTALDPKTLQAKGSYSGQAFSSTPVVFEFKGKTLIESVAVGEAHAVVYPASELGSAVSCADMESASSSMPTATMAMALPLPPNERVDEGSHFS